MRLTTGVVVEGVEDREGGRRDPQREPEWRGGFVVGHRQARLEKGSKVGFLAGFGFETYEESDFDHRNQTLGLGGRKLDARGHLEACTSLQGFIRKRHSRYRLRHVKIAIFVLNGVFDTALTAVLDAFSTANELAKAHALEVSPFTLSLTSCRSPARTAWGLSVPVEPIDWSTPPEWVVMPALDAKTPVTLLPALARPEVRAAMECLREWHRLGVRIATACTGSFILAESGLLREQVATTTWWLSPLFRRRYPDVSVDESRLVVASGRLVTGGAALGHLDLALWIIRQVSPAWSTLVARYLVADRRSSQAPYMIPDHLTYADPLVEGFERWARRRLAEGFSLDAAAEALATNKRTLQRRFHEVMGKSPLSYFQDLRVERAVHLLRAGDSSLETIAAEVGYADAMSLRALLRRRLGRGVVELRALARQG